MATTHTDAQVQAATNVRVQLHAAETLRAVEPRFDELSKRGQRAVASYVPARSEVRESNTTVDQLHVLLAQMLDPNSSTSDDASHLAVGWGVSTPTSGDTALLDEVYRTEITDSSVNGTELFTSTFLDTSEANGNDLEEVGLARSGTDGASDILNHSRISSISKSSEDTATIDVSLSFTAT